MNSVAAQWVRTREHVLEVATEYGLMRMREVRKHAAENRSKPLRVNDIQERLNREQKSKPIP